MTDPSTLVDRVKVFTTSSGTGPFTLGAAAEAFRGVEALTGGLIYSYAAENGPDFEVGQGQYVAETTQLIRTPFESSNGPGALVSFPANTPIAFTALASDLSGTGSATDAAASAAAAALSAGVATAAEEAAALSATAADGSALSAATSAADAANSADDAEAAAIAAAAAAATVGVPSYANTAGLPGQGDRTAIAVVSDLGTLAFNSTSTSADWNKLVDGTLAGKTPAIFIRGGDVTGKLIGVFPKADQYPWFQIGKIRARQANTVNNGTWEPVIYRGVTFDLNGNAVSAAQVIAVGPPVLWNVATLEFPPTISPTTPGEGFGWRGVSGTAAGASYATGLFQFEAETLTTTDYGRRGLPTAAEAGTVATANNVGQTVFAKPIDYFETRIAGAGLLGEWLFREGAGTIVADNSGNKRDIDFGTAHQSTYGSTGYLWTPQGLRLTSAMVQTPVIPGLKTLVIAFQPTREDGTNVQFNASASTALSSIYLRGSGAFNGTSTIRSGNGGEAIAPLYSDNGAAAFKLNRGGPILCFVEVPTGYNPQIGLGGQALVVSPTGRASRMTVNYVAAYSGSLSDDNCNTIRNGLCKVMALRGIYYDWRDCPIYHAGAFNFGQSNVGNGSVMLNGNGDVISAANADKALFTSKTQILSAGRKIESWMISPEPYQLGFNSVPGQVKAGGFEAGMAFAHQEAYQTVQRQLAVCKIAPGSAAVTGAGSNNTWDPANSVATGLIGYGLSRFWDMEQFYLQRGQGLRLLACNSQNGENDSNNTGAAAGNIAAYAPNMNTIWGIFKQQMNFSGLKLQVGQLPPWQGNSNFTNANVNALRAEQDVLVAANADSVLVPTASGLLGADLLHFKINDEIARGRTFYTGMNVT